MLLSGNLRKSLWIRQKGKEIKDHFLQTLTDSFAEKRTEQKSHFTVDDASEFRDTNYCW